MKNHSLTKYLFCFLFMLLMVGCKDDDCSTMQTWYEDADGLGDPTEREEACIGPSDFVDNADDPYPLSALNIGDEHAGGIIFSLNQTGESGLVCTTFDLGIRNWADAKAICNAYDGGNMGWSLPSIAELNLMYDNLHLQELGDFVGSAYWSSTPSISSGQGVTKNFSNGVENGTEGISFQNVRAYRAF